MRIKKFRKVLRERDLLPFLVTDLNDIKYLTGYSGTNAALLIGAKKSFFISDSRYEEYICSILPAGFRFFMQKGGLADAVRDAFIPAEYKALNIQAGLVTYSFYSELKKKLKGVKLIPLTDDPVAELRIIKDDNEIVLLRRAAEITDACFEHLLKFIKPGMTEWKISIEIDLFYKKNGCTGCSFDSIVASGTGSSMPHYIPSMKKIVEKGDALLIDMGCVYEGYNSDLTRTVFVDRIDAELESVYNIVYRAQAKALAAVRPGIEAHELDSAARSYIAEHGYGDNFGHGLGHGLGIEIHEAPAIKKNSSASLKKNMVITVEPGIYIPGKGGVRIEDMVLVTAGGYDVLTRCSKALTVI